MLRSSLRLLELLGDSAKIPLCILQNKTSSWPVWWSWQVVFFLSSFCSAGVFQWTDLNFNTITAILFSVGKRAWWKYPGNWSIESLLNKDLNEEFIYSLLYAKSKTIRLKREGKQNFISCSSVSFIRTSAILCCWKPSETANYYKMC